MHNPKYEEVLKSIPFRSVSFGSMAIQLYDLVQLTEAQLGYSIRPDGTSLITDEEGSWKENWLVIGYEDLSGNPIIIDNAAERCPVYTAVHGRGSWDANLIATDLRGFVKALETIAGLAKGRQNPVELEANPLSAEERDKGLAEIKKNSLGAEIAFWEEWLNQWE